ncbi:MAG: hypothetical protein KKD28_12030 [Chloroflexi bacterium]|nr:hypothetical protein [Chloroflexota bacterium]MBU1662186.1 hypothetical protein [Chloroflexota bacterium]
MLKGFTLAKVSMLADDRLLEIESRFVVASSRFTVRISEYYKSLLNKSPQARCVLIAGAGDAGQIVAREIFQRPCFTGFSWLCG